MHAQTLQKYTQLEQALGPYPGAVRGSGSTGGNSDAEEPPQEQKSMAMALLENPSVAPKVVGERIAEGWRAATTGSGWGLASSTARSSGRGRFRLGVPGTKMMIGGRGALRF